MANGTLQPIEKPARRVKVPKTLKRRKPLKRTKLNPRFKRISKIGKRARRRMRRWNNEKRLAYETCGGLCEVIGPGCTQEATDPHHKKPRGRGGADTKENTVWCCRTCHRWIHEHPKLSKAAGWLD